MRFAGLVVWLIISLWSDPSLATRYWVATTGSDSNACSSIDGDNDPLTYKLTIVSAKACMSGGDILTIKSGTYTGANNRLESFPSGTSSNPTIIEGDPSSSSHCAKDSNCPTVIQNNGTYGIWTGDSSYIFLRNLKMSGASNVSYPIFIGSMTGVATLGIHIKNVEATESLTATAVMNGPTSSFSIIEDNNLHHNGANRSSLGAYLQGDDVTFRNNWVHHNSYYGVQCYTSSTLSDMRPDRCKVHYNLIENNSNASGELGLAMGGQDTEVIGNVIKGAFSNGFDGGSPNMKVLNNTFPSNGITIGGSGSNNSNIIVQNNVIFGGVSVGSNAAATITNSFNACPAASSCGSSKLTFAALTDLFVSATDFTLKSGSPAINAGTASAASTARPCNGTCDIGAFESIPAPSASITTNRVTLTFPMNTAVPIQNISTTGATISCTGSACPASPSVSAAARSVGTDTVVELTISGISGNACQAANQTWRTSYDSSLGSWSSTDNIGESNQKVFSYTNLSVTNNCTGNPPTGDPAGYHVYYKFDDGSGTNANDESTNNLDGTLMGGPTWGAGKTGSAVITTSGTSQYIAVPYGSGINPSTQSLTIAFGVNVPAGQESSSRGEFGTSVGTNQRLLIHAVSGTWRLGIQGSNAGSGASNLAVTSGWNHLCLNLDSGTDTATLYLNGIAGTGSASKSYTSYTLASNFTLGLYDINTSPGGTYDDFIVYASAADCGAIYASFQGTATAPTGTLSQEAIQFQDVYLPSVGGGPTNLAPMNGAQSVVSNGAVAVIFQIHCENIADCDPTAFKLTYKRNGSSTKITVPNTETSDGIWMWGNDSNSFLNTGATTTRLTGTCTLTNGTTQLTADQVPSIDLPQDGCIMLRYIVRVRTANDYFDLGLQTASGIDLPGGYDHEARINVIGAQASGGF